MKAVLLTGAGATVEDVVTVARRRATVAVAPAVVKRLKKARQVLDHVAASGQKIYGLNTGLGANLGTPIRDDASAFQRQLVVPVAIGGSRKPDRHPARLFHHFCRKRESRVGVENDAGRRARFQPG